MGSPAIREYKNKDTSACHFLYVPGQIHNKKTENQTPPRVFTANKFAIASFSCTLNANSDPGFEDKWTKIENENALGFRVFLLGLFRVFRVFALLFVVARYDI